MAWFPRWAALCLFPFFAGCAILPAEKDVARTTVIPPVAEPGRARSENFELIGRISVKGGNESFSSGVKWHHTECTDEILLLSPLGQTLIHIGSHLHAGVHLTTSEQESYFAPDVESLTGEVLGWRLPVMNLQYWVQGIHSPLTRSKIDRGSDGKIVAIRQDDWEIRYLSYFPIPGARMIPAKGAHPKSLLLTHDVFQIKLIIDRWISLCQDASMDC